ncbi:MAG: hypothetical protein JNJ58_00210 [Chitinophagaceae bacterium]|nr:hypothetical protein [Chitinophagaceae bacterium]
MTTAEVQETSYSEPMELNDVLFINEQRGFIVGGERYQSPLILQTEDGGAHWSPVSLPAGDVQKALYDMDVYEGSKLCCIGYNGVCYSSSDSGHQWQYAQHGSWAEFQAISFRDADTVFIAGGLGFKEGFVESMASDGRNDQVVNEKRNFEISDIEFVSPTTGYLCGYGALMKTTDGGHVWTFTTAKNDYFKAMAWTDHIGVVVGYEGSIERSSNAGESWKVLRNGNDFTKKKVRFRDICTNHKGGFVAVGDKGAVWLSEDEGNTWVELKSFTKEDLHGVSFVNQHTFVVCGKNGRIFKIGI